VKRIRIAFWSVVAEVAFWLRLYRLHRTACIRRWNAKGANFRRI
jgi:hypothetical protein